MKDFIIVCKNCNFVRPMTNRVKKRVKIKNMYATAQYKCPKCGSYDSYVCNKEQYKEEKWEKQ